MSPELRAQGFPCKGCGRVFTSLTRLQHHVAAEHAPRTAEDIRTSRSVPHVPGQGRRPGRVGYQRARGGAA